VTPALRSLRGERRPLSRAEGTAGTLTCDRDQVPDLDRDSSKIFCHLSLSLPAEPSPELDERREGLWWPEWRSVVGATWEAVFRQLGPC
jgi:hypothetical protein